MTSFSFFFKLIRNNIRGELTVAHTREQFSLKDNSFIAAVASSLQISSSKVIILLVTVFPRIYAHVLVSAPLPTPPLDLHLRVSTHGPPLSRMY